MSPVDTSFEDGLGDLLVKNLQSYDQKLDERNFHSSMLSGVKRQLDDVVKSVLEQLDSDLSQDSFFYSVLHSDRLDRFKEASVSMVGLPELDPSLEDEPSDDGDDYPVCSPSPPRSPTPPLDSNDSFSDHDDDIPGPSTSHLPSQIVSVSTAVSFSHPKEKLRAIHHDVTKTPESVSALRILKLANDLINDLSSEDSFEKLDEFIISSSSHLEVDEDVMLQTDWMEKFVACLPSSVRLHIPYHYLSCKNKFAARYARKQLAKEKIKAKRRYGPSVNSSQLSIEGMKNRAKENSHKLAIKRRHFPDVVASTSVDAVAGPPEKWIGIDDKVNRCIHHPLIAYSTKHQYATNIKVVKNLERISLSVFFEVFVFANADNKRDSMLMACLTAKVTKVKRQFGADGIGQLCMLAPPDAPPRFLNRKAYVSYDRYMTAGYDVSNPLLVESEEPNAWLGARGRQMIDGWKKRTDRVNEMFNSARLEGVSEMTVMVQNFAHLFMYHFGSRLGDKAMTRREMIDRTVDSGLIDRRQANRLQRPLTKFILYMQSTRNRCITSDDLLNIPLDDQSCLISLV